MTVEAVNTIRLCHDSNNTVVAEYVYDAWGVCTILRNVGNICCVKCISCYKIYVSI